MCIAYTPAVYIYYLCHLAWVDQKRRHALYNYCTCVLAEQFIQTANYCKKAIFSLPVATVYTSAKPKTAFRGDTNYILIRYVYNIKRSPSGLALYIVYVPSRHDLSNTCVTLRGWIKSAATHFISYKVRASRTVYTDRKLLQKINFLTSCLHKCKTSDGILW